MPTFVGSGAERNVKLRESRAARVCAGGSRSPEYQGFSEFRAAGAIAQESARTSLPPSVAARIGDRAEASENRRFGDGRVTKPSVPSRRGTRASGSAGRSVLAVLEALLLDLLEQRGAVEPEQLGGAVLVPLGLLEGLDGSGRLRSRPRRRGSESPVEGTCGADGGDGRRLRGSTPAGRSRGSPRRRTRVTTRRSIRFSSSRTLPGQSVAAEQVERLLREALHRRAPCPGWRCPGSAGRAGGCLRGRSRSGGTSMGITFRRKKRSSRKRCSRIACSRFWLVAAMTRTSTVTVFEEPTGSKVLVLEDAQQLHLQVGAHVADLVEEDACPSSASEKRPSRLADRVREGAPDVAEELGFEQLLGNRAAVHGDEHALRAAAVVVDRARDQLLAGAALARDQHRAVGRPPPC